MNDFTKQIIAQLMSAQPPQQSPMSAWEASTKGAPPIGPDETQLLRQNDMAPPLELFRPGVPTPFGRDAQQMRDQNGILSSAQTQYANDRPIQNFRPGIKNPIWGWGR